MTYNRPAPGAARDAMDSDCATCQESLDAFALGALEGIERSRIEQHMLWCGPCRRAHAEIRRATDLLPFLSPPAAPSAAARKRLFERISDETTAIAESSAIFSNPWGTGEPAAQPKREEQNKTQTGAWQRWIAPALIAPLAICLIVLSAWTNSLRNEVSMLGSAEASGTTVTLTSPSQSGMQLYDFRPACPTCADKQASGQLGVNPEGSIGLVVVRDLDPNEKHQVWCIDRNGEKILVSDLKVEHTGSVFQTVNFPEPLGGYEQVYVARHDGTDDPDAELLVAVNGEHQTGAPDDIPMTPVSN